MSYKSAEKIFYEQHYGDFKPNVDKKIDLESLRRKYFSKGRRYHLVEKIISNTPSKYNLLEMGCTSYLNPPIFNYT